jgi:hypothetical protein
MFKITPKHWYQWLQPSFYRYKKFMETIINQKDYKEAVSSLVIKESITGIPTTEKEIEKVAKNIFN